MAEWLQGMAIRVPDWDFQVKELRRPLAPTSL